MAEYQGATWKNLGVQAAVVFGIAAAVGGIAIYKESHTDINSSTNDIDRDGRPALAQGDYSNNASGAPTTTSESSATNSNYVTNTNCEATPPGHLTNPSTCADYKLVPDPNSSRTCVQKGKYSIDNPRTLWGMKAVLGDPINQTDGNVTIYDSSGNPIGYFADGIPATFDGMDVQAELDAFACLNN